MLNTETKRRIDTARDILVGKVPDPKTQVEQITFAMIYKFMDDMDQLSVKLGGKPSFFDNGYEQFAWSKLMDKRLGGESRLDLYVRALDQMSQNPFIPQLFRDVFKGAFLPYRDSETLNLFLKEMNGFTYGHSEDLGDAYEYLLSIFATQGKAGQFRTPRHIIDFIVDCVDPDKEDTVLDPACGTAGFLISAYKHILEKYQNNPLTPDQKQRLTENFVGYDISPDMVRLSRVNMYLHQFPNPTIFEYDTLTTEDRWEDTFDVILANPPFMTPKGGIRPHKRFAVRANRSEVLFVDYIAEHLNVGGRAGVIVPEGIIFQSSNAYKALRKMLVEEGYLYAVVSLPAGIFQPYSGVKTSVLLMDKDIARESDSILFVKVENDGYGLGAQRNEIEENDLPEALEIIKAFQVGPHIELNNTEIALVVKKSTLDEDANYNLSGERYKLRSIISKNWPMISLGVLAEFQGGLWKSDKEPLKIVKIIRNTNFGKNGELNLQNIAEHPVEVRKLEKRKLKVGDIILENSGGGPKQPVGRVVYFDVNDGSEYSFSNFTTRIRAVDKRISPKYLYLTLKGFYDLGETEKLQNRTSGIRNLNKTAYKSIKIPLPPLEFQQAIVDEIEGYQKVIDGARQVVENYKPVIHIDPDWPMVKLGEVCEVISGQSPKGIYYNKDGKGTPFYQGKSNFTEMFIGPPKKWTTSETKIALKDDILMSVRAPVGPVNLAIQRICIGRGLAAIRSDSSKLLVKFLFSYLQTIENNIKGNIGSTFASITNQGIKDISIPLPSVDQQKEIVEQINQEQIAIKASKSLIDSFEEKVKACLNRIWEKMDN